MTRSPVLRPWMGVGLALSAGLALAAEVAARQGWIIGNPSPSVARGLYIRASPATASHVTFCLGERELRLPLCAPHAPDAPRILKRIAARHPDGSLSVQGDTPRALDSRLIGPVAADDIRGWWRPLLLIDPEDPPAARKQDQTAGDAP